MASVVLQQGHVARTSGATGTFREQELARRLAAAIAPLLVQRGHSVRVIGADDPIPASDVFVALHGDGSTNRSRRGASVGYRDEPGRRLATAWKRRHQLAGYDAGFLPDNYTANLRDYYGVRRSTARYRFIAEHGHLTNPTDEAVLFGNIEAFARAHVDAIGDVVGHPAPGVPPAPSAAPDDFKEKIMALPVLTEGAGAGERENQRHYVGIMQSLMQWHGAVPVNSVNRPEGRFDHTTYESLKAWQRRTGVLEPDGVCGPKTWSWLVGI